MKASRGRPVGCQVGVKERVAMSDSWRLPRSRRAEQSRRPQWALLLLERESKREAIMTNEDGLACGKSRIEHGMMGDGCGDEMRGGWYRPNLAVGSCCRSLDAATRWAIAEGGRL